MILNDTNYAYNIRREILIQFIKEGHRVTLIAEFLSRVEELRQMGCELIEVKPGRRGTNVFQDIKLFLTYYTVLRRLNPDLVFTNNIKPNIYAGLACRILKIPYVPNITGLGTALEIPGPLQKLTTFLYRVGVRNATAIFFQNEENARFFQNRRILSGKTKQILLPGSGVNLQAHPLLPYPKEEKLCFLFVARVMKEKGIDLFLAAARKFHSGNCIFEVVGMCDDPKYLEILKNAQDQGIVVYHGLQSDVTPFYQRCSCFLYPSYYPEGMSNVLLEAAASGRPVIAADRSGCREIVDDGISGYIVPVNDENAVLHAVEKFMSLSTEQRQEMGLSGRAKVEREFDRQIVVRQYWNVMEMCLDEKR